MAAWGIEWGQAWGLLLLPAAILPWLASPLRRVSWVSHDLLPEDPFSRVLDWLVPLGGSLTLGCLALGIAGPYLPERTVVRIGKGAQLVLLLDRSGSMDNTFAGRAPSGGEESKGQAAARLLQAFLDRRPYDWVGVAGFSTGPLFQCPLTADREANRAAVATIALPALAHTHVAKGLALALDFFADLPLNGSRAILLVSDGAAVIEPAIQSRLRVAFKRHQVRLYWIFLRDAGGPGIYQAPSDPLQDNPHARPAYYLHRFFQSLGVPYQAFEAEDPDGLQRAIRTVDRLEKQPFHYEEVRPRRDLAFPFYVVAFGGAVLLFGLKLMEA